MPKTKDKKERKTDADHGATRIFSAAVNALAEWRGGTPLNALAMPPEARRLLTDLLHSLFRHLARLDWMIDGLASGRRVKPQIRDLLRIGLASCLYQDGIHAGIAVDSCVRLAKRLSGARTGGFVNAVLREALRREETAGTGPAPPDYVRLGLSPELYAAWRRWMTPEQLARTAAELAKPAALIVRSRGAQPPGLPCGLAEILIPLPAPDWAPASRLWRCLDPARLFASQFFQEGRLYVQDPSTLLAPAMLAIDSGERIADLCAAPGGKTLCLAEKLPPGASLLVADRSCKRLEKLQDNLGACGDSIHLFAADATRPPLAPDSLDAVLLDVPCSNSGVVRRRPDVRWRFSKESLEQLVKLQIRIMLAGEKLVRPGGRMVYSTCSLEPEENSRQIRQFLEMKPAWFLVADRQLLPSENHDGAYAALLKKKTDALT